MSANEWMQVVLTVGDHTKNGFVALAVWEFRDEDAARAFMAEQDDAVDAEAEPDAHEAEFTFILDLYASPYEMIDTGKRLLPTQVAMALAPEQVRSWLLERPDPDSVAHRSIPLFELEETLLSRPR